MYTWWQIVILSIDHFSLNRRTYAKLMPCIKKSLLIKAKVENIQWFLQKHIRQKFFSRFLYFVTTINPIMWIRRRLIVRGDWIEKYQLSELRILSIGIKRKISHYGAMYQYPTKARCTNPCYLLSMSFKLFWYVYICDVTNIVVFDEHWAGNDEHGHT